MESQTVDVYRSSLAELNTAEKFQINALTMMAEDNKEYAIQIAACIENYLKSAPNKQKLPILYLIDSICKNNPKSSYVQLFTQNIVSNFCNVFKVSEEKTRVLLYKLRLTWKKARTFPVDKLNAIDLRVREIDPKWPILENVKAAESAAADQKSKAQTQQNQSSVENKQPQQSAGAKTGPNANNTNQTKSNTRNRQSKSRGSKKQRTANNNNNNAGPNHSNQALDQKSGPIVQGGKNGIPIHLTAQQNLLPVTQPMLPPDQHAITPFYTHILPPQAAAITNFQQPPSPNPYPTIAPFGYPTTDGMYTDMTTILQPHLSMPQAAQPTPPVPQQATSQAQINPISMMSEQDLITLNSLYGGKQCSNCSLRFDVNDKHAYNVHLDWHFRENRKGDTVFARRRWYYPLNLWIQFREISDDDVQENINSDNNNANDVLISHQIDNEVPTAPASKEDDKNICSVCHETFEKFWAEEEEEWRLRNACLHDDQRVYHPLCLMDMSQASVTR